MLSYTQDELNSLWLRLKEKGSNIDMNDRESTQPLVNVAAGITKHTDTEQQMQFETSEDKATAYTDFAVPRNPIRIIICSRIRRNPNEPWGNWTCRMT